MLDISKGRTVLGTDQCDFGFRKWRSLWVASFVLLTGPFSLLCIRYLCRKSNGLLLDRHAQFLLKDLMN